MAQHDHTIDHADLDTVLGSGYEGGTDLSGGQWQRVALARALSAVQLGAGLVLLDEPTAQLDVRGEAEIFDRILAATRHCTTILISHRFSTVRHADRICVLEHGRVIELGSPDGSWQSAGAIERCSSCKRSASPKPGKRRGRPMTSSADGARVGGDDLPPALSSMLAGAFQDFFRFELRAHQAIGLGDVPRVNDEPAVVAAVDRAGAHDVVARLPSGLDTQLGPTGPGGVEVSFGQWQKLALARGFMRDRPLLLVPDEPTAALDAETEHALFERYAAATRAERRDGRITLLVSHRFSTVRMADLIVVLDGARVVEAGTHEELMSRQGTYGELYSIQEAAYRRSSSGHRR